MKCLKLFLKKRNILPKSIYKRPTAKEYSIIFYSKTEKRLFLAGVKPTLEEAIMFRDQFIEDNIDGLLKGYHPRGISTQGKKYRAKIPFESNEKYIGGFDTIDEATLARYDYLDSLKAVMPKDKNDLPEGILKSDGKFLSGFKIDGNQFFLRPFTTLEKAIACRNDYLESLK